MVVPLNAHALLYKYKHPITKKLCYETERGGEGGRGGREGGRGGRERGREGGRYETQKECKHVKERKEEERE